MAYDFSCTIEKSRSRLREAHLRLHTAIENQTGMSNSARAYITASRNYRRLVKQFIAGQVSWAATKSTPENNKRRREKR